MIERAEDVAFALGDQIFVRFGVAERRLTPGVADGSVSAEALLEHSHEHGYFAIDIVEDPNLALAGMEAMETPRVLHERALPRHGKREEERVQAAVIEAFADVSPDREEEAVLVRWDGLELRAQ